MVTDELEKVIQSMDDLKKEGDRVTRRAELLQILTSKRARKLLLSPNNTLLDESVLIPHPPGSPFVHLILFSDSLLLLKKESFLKGFSREKWIHLSRVVGVERGSGREDEVGVNSV